MKTKLIHIAILLIVLADPLLSVAQQTKHPTFNLKKLIDSIDIALNKNYIFPDKAKEITHYLKSQLKKKAYATLLDPYVLASQLKTDIYKIHRDPHMHVVFNPDMAKEMVNRKEPAKTELMEMDKQNNYMFKKAEVLPGNIGYLLFNGFVKYTEESRPVISSAMKFLANTNALIIDLRYNGGGDPKMVNYIESFFFKDKVHMNDIVNRPTKDTTVFYTDPEKTGGLTLSMPVYILTSSKTFSAAEDFSYGMQTVKRATIVGETTGGGAHPTEPYSVGQGFVVFVPFARSLNPITKTDWEGTGVVPDIKVTKGDALLKAQHHIFQEKYNAATNEKDKRKYQFFINSLIESENPISASALNQFVGNYGDLKFYMQNGHLFCKNPEGNNELQLKPISDGLFVLEENVQVEFFKDSSGKYSKLRILFADGNYIDK